MPAPVPVVLHVLGWSPYESYLAEPLAEQVGAYVASALGLGLSTNDIREDVHGRWRDRFSSVSVEALDTRRGKVVEVTCVALSRPVVAAPGVEVAA